MKEADWAFLDGNDVDVVLDNPPCMNVRKFNAYDFLHGICTTFAQYLNDGLEELKEDIELD